NATTAPARNTRLPVSVDKTDFMKELLSGSYDRFGQIDAIVRLERFADFGAARLVVLRTTRTNFKCAHDITQAASVLQAPIVYQTIQEPCTMCVAAACGIDYGIDSDSFNGMLSPVGIERCSGGASSYDDRPQIASNVFKRSARALFNNRSLVVVGRDDIGQVNHLLQVFARK